MSRRPRAGTFAGPLSTVRYTSAPCDLDEHASCASGPDRRAGMLPCSCSCHDEAYRARYAYRSTRCQRAEHAECPGPRGGLWAKIPGRRDDVAVPCTCECHQEATS